MPSALAVLFRRLVGGAGYCPSIGPDLSARAQRNAPATEMAAGASALRRLTRVCPDGRVYHVAIDTFLGDPFLGLVACTCAGAGADSSADHGSRGSCNRAADHGTCHGTATGTESSTGLVIAFARLTGDSTANGAHDAADRGPDRSADDHPDASTGQGTGPGTERFIPVLIPVLIPIDVHVSVLWGSSVVCRHLDPVSGLGPIFHLGFSRSHP